MLRGSGLSSLYASPTDHPHPWLKLQHNIMAEHYKAFKSFVMSSSTLSSMLQNQQVERMVATRRPHHSKRYLVCPSKPLSFLNPKEDDLERLTSDESPITSGESLITSGGSLLCEHPMTPVVSFSDVCLGENFSLFEEVKIEEADDKESTISQKQTISSVAPVQASVVSSSEGKSSGLRDVSVDESGCYVTKLQSRESDVMWSCYSSDAAVSSSTYSEDRSQHSPPESSLISVKDVAKYLSETPPQNNRLNDFSQQDIQRLNRHFRHPAQINQTPNPGRSQSLSQINQQNLENDESRMPEALDLSRPKSKNDRIQDENTKPGKRRRVLKSKKKCKNDIQEQVVAIDFSLKSHSKLGTDSKGFTPETYGIKSLTTSTNNGKADDNSSVLCGIQNGVKANGRYKKLCDIQNGVQKKASGKYKELCGTENGVRANGDYTELLQLQNNGNTDILCNTGILAKNPKTSRKTAMSVLAERGQLTLDHTERFNKGLESTAAVIPPPPVTNGKAKTHACKFCGKLFAQRSSVHTHERTHTGVRPYKCEYCGRDFIDCSTYTKHVRLHTGERPYSCDVCGRGFSQSGNMLRHKAARHPEIQKVTSGLKNIKTQSVQ
ncbi:neurotrophin receptor-interacting factor 1-like isoform X2 [Gigantopelta aegis]|uniref:neurotrophin receptor-interacting factor 1-like isoform X2 n=1 Tax=Gigantopelta aegis TaxID=1735272 RepID=UPI001B88CCD3|nr:neurotrophin receptor-interacting factor 1-like isoform X2 [Gigantopelta aegis]